jgi:hypothetical protein
MKFISLKRALEKYGTKLEVTDHRSDSYFFYNKEKTDIGEFFYTESYDHINVNIRSINDKHDLYSDYHAGLFYSTIKGIIAQLEYADKMAIANKAKFDAEKIIYISVERLEGPTELCIETEFKSLKDAQDYLNDSVLTCPKDGYDKFKVSIMFNDGKQYSPRMDLKHYLNPHFRFNELNIIEDLNASIDYLNKCIQDASLAVNRDFNIRQRVFLSEVYNRLLKEAV